MNRLDNGLHAVAGVGFPICASLLSKLTDLAPVFEVISMMVGIVVALIIGYNKLCKGYLDRKEQRLSIRGQGLDIRDREQTEHLLKDLFKPKRRKKK